MEVIDAYDGHGDSDDVFEVEIFSIHYSERSST